ncbi:MAG: hypothetical protein JKY32_07240 [Rhizobiales bacterium]|nr:hypothetical protein [Hyphomicrobiales bacterium]
MVDFVTEGYMSCSRGEIIDLRGRNPLFVHGYLNRLDDFMYQPRKTAGEIRRDLGYINAVLSDDVMT